MTVVAIDPLPQMKVRLTPMPRPDEDRWRVYLDACRSGGARNDPILRAMVAPQLRVADIVGTLERAGFACQVHPDVARSISANRAYAHAAADEVLRRVQAMQLRDDTGERVELRAFQAEGGAWVSTRLRALLTDEMGLGKTCQIVVAWPPCVPILVVGPKVAMGTWATHTRWRGDYRAQFRAGLSGFSWPEPGVVAICNYEIMPPFELLKAKPEEVETFTPAQQAKLRWVQELAASVPPQMIVVCDEAHKLKNLEAKRTIRAHAIRDLALARDGWIWAVTGTPLYNHPPDLYAMIQLIRCEAETWPTLESFCASFGGSIDDKTWSKEGVSPEVPKILQRVMLRREKADVLTDLPEKQWEHVLVPIPDDARKIADEAIEMLAAVGVEVLDDHPRSCKCLVCRVDVAQATRLGAIPFDLISRARAALATAKVEFLRDYVETLEEQQTIAMSEDDEPVVVDPFLVWSCHRTPVDALGNRDGWGLLTGDQSNPEVRQRLERDFQAGKYRAMALTVQAGGVAITLTRACLSIHVDLPWTPADQQQCEDRIHRIGQRNVCRYVYLVADHRLDKWLVALLGHKAGIEAASVRAAATSSSQMRVRVGPDAVPASAAVAVSSGAKRPPRDEERDVCAWIQTTTHGLARALNRQFKLSGTLSDAQWSAARTQARK